MSKLKLAILLCLVIIVFYGCSTNEMNDSLEADEKENMTSDVDEYKPVSNDVVLYEQFTYDYPDNYVKDLLEDVNQYDLTTEETEQYLEITLLSSSKEKETAILKLLDSGQIKLRFAYSLLNLLERLYMEYNNAYKNIWISDQKITNFEEYHTADEMTLILNNKLKYLMSMDFYVFDHDKRQRLHEESMIISKKMIEINEVSEFNSTDSMLYDAYNYAGLYYYNNQNYAEAIHYFLKLLEFDDDIERYVFDTSYSYKLKWVVDTFMKNKDVESAVKYMSEFEKNPEIKKTTKCYLLAVYSFDFGEKKDAFQYLEYFHELLSDDFNRDDLLMFLELSIDLYLEFDMYDEAKNNCSKLIEAAPDKIGLIIDKGYDVTLDIDLSHLKKQYSDEFIEKRDFEFE